MIQFIKNRWGYILWGCFLLLCWFYIGFAIMWIGFYLLVVFGGLSLFSNMAAVRFTKNFTHGRAAGSRLLRWFLFPAAALTGVALILLGGYSNWQERPKFLKDRVSSIQVFAPHDYSSYSSYSSFSSTWRRLSLLAQAPDSLSQSDPSNKLYNKLQFFIHPDLLVQINSDAAFRKQFIATLETMPKDPGKKNTNHYMKHFPKDGPIELPAGDQRLVFNAHTYQLEKTYRTINVTDWKLEDIIPNTGKPLPDTSACYLKIICLGLD